MADEEAQKEEAKEEPKEAAAEAPAAPATEPPNKLHEWTAAAVLMMILAGILYTFVTFLRGTGL